MSGAVSNTTTGADRRPADAVVWTVRAVATLAATSTWLRLDTEEPECDERRDI
jgi:hypothetical protein